MVIMSDSCPRRETRVQNGNGIIHMKDLATKEEMYGHARLFATLTIDPGCSIGYHCHEHETEFFYVAKGEAVFNDNGEERVIHPGDVCSTGGGAGHSVENRTGEPVELVALIVLE